MKDSIDKNLEFKTFIFVTLLGAWLWFIKYYYALLPLTSNEYFSMIIIILSFSIFYPMVRLGMMLIYTSIYQIEDRDDKIKIIVSGYGKSSLAFFSWWPIALITVPVFVLFVLLGNGINEIILAFTIPLTYVLYLKLYFLKKIFTFKDLIEHYKFFSRTFFVYLAVFISIIIISWYSRN